jgi:hypothetical protein
MKRAPTFTDAFVAALAEAAKDGKLCKPPIPPPQDDRPVTKVDENGFAQPRIPQHR